LITLTINTLDPLVGDDGAIAKKPRTDRPRQRSFSPAEKLRLLAGYETATESGIGNAFLRQNGLYSSLISEWRRTRDAGPLKGKPAGSVVGRPSTDPSNPVRNRSGRDRPAAPPARPRGAAPVRTEAALSITGKHRRSWP
jgi:transposase